MYQNLNFCFKLSIKNTFVNKYNNDLKNNNDNNYDYYMSSTKYNNCYLDLQ